MRELPLLRILAALTPGRIFNALQVLAASALSRWLGKPVLWGAPYVLSIEPTNCCDLRCLHCETGAGFLTRPRGYLDLNLYRRILDMNHRHLVYLLLYDQGEPLLHPHFPEMIRMAKQHHLCVISSTNGQRLADKTYAQEIVESGLDALIVSADGITQESYELYRRGGKLDQVRAGIAYICEHRRALRVRAPRIYLQFVVMRHNEHELAQLPEVAAAWGADRVLLKSLYLRTKDRAEEILPDAERFRRYRLQDGHWLLKARPLRPCTRLWYSAVIHWDGNVVPCCFDKDGSHILGHASKPLAELWRSELYCSFRNQQFGARHPHICQNCSDGLKIYPT